MGRPFLNFLKVFVPFSLILFFIQYYITSNYVEATLYYSTVANYSFHILATLIVYGILLIINLNFQDKTGFVFMGLGLLKMFAAVLFLLPALLNDEVSIFVQVIAFFAPYFIFLIFETTFAVKLINRNK
ncbi:hypothetical protein [Zunongwangia sp. HGR-M22]|uniref:hypothetical protein n=1 Tax=Zunongwangia sp. HGR-M22 TaxID=3015168 RepID=UPI0022DDECC4|nr:hypothetical protein [Zunongwangia sp. HGR-M22]WBL25644.1 hypothetical protein PBT91_17335 [Zunongwangia sp. HGR-M22]